MNRIRHIRRLAGILAGLAGALLASAVAAPVAFASRVPPPGSYGGTVQASPQEHTVVVGGMPGWQIFLIALAAALFAATMAVLADRARTSRRKAIIPAA
jgi:Domain of unknown function